MKYIHICNCEVLRHYLIIMSNIRILEKNTGRFLGMRVFVNNCNLDFEVTKVNLMFCEIDYSIIISSRNRVHY